MTGKLVVAIHKNLKKKKKKKTKWRSNNWVSEAKMKMKNCPDEILEDPQQYT